MTTIIKAIRRARDLVKAGWTQRAFARTASGVSVDHFHPDATCFCGLGAVMRAAPSMKYGWDAVDAVETTLRETTGIAHLPDYNDDSTRTKEDMLALFDATIQRLEPVPAQAQPEA